MFLLNDLLRSSCKSLVSLFLTTLLCGGFLISHICVGHDWMLSTETILFMISISMKSFTFGSRQGPRRVGPVLKTTCKECSSSVSPRRHENTNNRPNHNRKGTLSKKRRYSQNIVLCNYTEYDWGWAGQILKCMSSIIPDQCWVIPTECLKREAD